MTEAADGVPGPLSGATRVYAILGDPIEQVASPTLFNTAFRNRGMDAVLVPLHVPPTALRQFIETVRAVRNLDGLIITVPHKIAAASCVDELGPNARRTGAVNTIRKGADGRLQGDNFDGIGFVRGITDAGHTIAGRRVLIIGAGGAGRAVAHAVADAGPERIGLFDIDGRRSRDLVAAISDGRPTLEAFVTQPDCRGFDLLINCTSVGMRADDRLPLDITGLTASTLVADIILKPAMTRLLREAEARGCAIHVGLRMLGGQTDAVIDFFRGWETP